MEIINICYDKNFVSEAARNVDIRNINQIPNFSANKILMSFLNKMQKKQSLETLVGLCNKLREKGTLTFTLLDFDQLVTFYLEEKISLDNIIIHTKGTECLISRAEIIQSFHKSPQLSIDSITHDEMYATYTISRTSV